MDGGNSITSSMSSIEKCPESCTFTRLILHWSLKCSPTIPNKQYVPILLSIHFIVVACSVQSKHVIDTVQWEVLCVMWDLKKHSKARKASLASKVPTFGGSSDPNGSLYPTRAH